MVIPTALVSARPLLLWLACVSCAGASAPTTADSGITAYVLGVAQDGGMPHLGCERDCCVEARRSGEVLYPVSLGIHDRHADRLLLVEASPAIEAQVALLHDWAGVAGRGRRPVDAILLTHAHIGHYLGLAQLGREVAGTAGIDVWVSPRMAAFLRDNGPWSQLVTLGQIKLREFEVGRPFAPWPGLDVTAIAVPHRDEFSDTMAFKVKGLAATLLFVPDIDRWSRAPGLLDRLLDGVDVAFLDGSFYDGSEVPDRDMSEIPHPPMIETMRLLGESALATPGRLRFLHFNHSNPVLRSAALQREVRARGFALARRGDHATL